MSKVIDFLEAVKKDPALQAKIQVVVKKHQGEQPGEAGLENIFNEEVASVAKEAGFVISFADCKALAEQARAGKLSDQDLALVSGGGKRPVAGREISDEDLALVSGGGVGAYDDLLGLALMVIKSGKSK